MRTIEGTYDEYSEVYYFLDPMVNLWYCEISYPDDESEFVRGYGVSQDEAFADAFDLFYDEFGFDPKVLVK